MKQVYRLNIILSVLMVVFFIFSIIFGSVKLDFSNPDEASLYIIQQIRIPRALCCIFAGILLALSGMMFQCVFKNPMADSYILGVSSGASCAVAFSYILYSVHTSLFAITGSLLTAILLFSLNKKSIQQLLLSGIAANFFLSALTTLLIHLSKHNLDSVLYWSMGSFSNATYEKSILMFIVLIAVIIINLTNSDKMDILMMDDATALSNGINIRSSKLFLLSVASVSTAIVVSFFGVIGFVGLMSPHIVRLITGPKHSRLTIATALFGADIMLIADLLCRIIVSPSELPVGIITSIIGAPIFFLIIKRNLKW